MFGNKPGNGKTPSAPQAENKPAAAPKPAAPAPAAKADDKHLMMNMIGKGTVIEGNVMAEGDLTIEGTIKGDVTTKTTLVVGPNSVVEGNLIAQHAEIAGKVMGSVKALGLLTIRASGKIDGDVITRNLNVEAGSTFNGRFSVGADTSSMEIPKKAAAAPAAAAQSVF